VPCVLMIFNIWLAERGMARPCFAGTSEGGIVRELVSRSRVKVEDGFKRRRK
jgi:hypothetical protein